MEKFKNIFSAFFSFCIILFLIAAVISVLAITGGAVMSVLGLEYQSIKSLIVFFLLTATFGFPLELLAKALPKALLSLDKISCIGAKILFVLLDMLSTIIVMTIIDDYMTSISANMLSIAVIALIMALVSIKDIEAAKK